MKLVLTQTAALFLDAYRDLNSKKLFWVTMGLSLLVVLIFAMFGLGKNGLTFLWIEWPMPLFNSGIFPESLFYRFVFVNFGIELWLTWIAAVLAVISTASIIPDFVASGSIELVLSKPIGRLRLLFTKYLTGLLFVGLQVFVFTCACFVVMGIRGGSWEWRVWLAVPIVLAFFSYLFCVSALVGVLTRSTIAALIATLLFWFAVFSLHATDVTFLQLRESAAITLDERERIEEKRRAAAARMLEQFKADGTEYVVAKEGQDQLEAISPPLMLARTQLAEARESLETWKRWSRYAYIVRLPLPKTSETIDLLSRNLISMDELRRTGFLPEESEDVMYDDETGEPVKGARRQQRRSAEARVIDIQRERGIGWTLGTSMAFQGVVLFITGMIFRRRDF